MPIDEFSSHDLALLCGYLSRKTGMILDELRQEQLVSVVRARMLAVGAANFGDYYQRLALAPGDDMEFKALMDLFTIKETSFFRHNEQFEALRDYCLPRLMAARNREKTIRIWSAGCSYGEEPYSIAMVVRDRISSASDWRVNIWATDISQEALEGARRGVYQQRSVRGMDARYLKRYFTVLHGGFALSSEIKQMVAFDYFNLAADFSVPAQGQFWDIIFCRNVIIYLSKEHIRRVLNKFHASLADEGYLFPGYSEVLRYHSEDFVPLEVQGTFIYPKRQANEKALNSWKASPAGQRLVLPGRRKVGGKLPPPINVHADGAGKEAGGGSGGKHQDAVAERGIADDNLPVGKGKEDSIPQPQQSPGRLENAGRMAEQGQTQQALELLGAMLETDPLDIAALNLVAVIWLNLKDFGRAIDYFKKSLYLDPLQPMVRLHLADAYRGSARIGEARREYANVIAILEKEPSNGLTEALKDYSRDMILAAARSHLQVLTDLTGKS